MRFNPDIVRIQHDTLYHPVVDFLNHLLDGESPSLDLMKQFYGEPHAEYVRGIIERFLSNNMQKLGNRRPHDTSAPSEISSRRRKLSNDRDFLSIQSKLLFWDLPTIEEMETFYGTYGGAVRDIFKLYIHYDLKRKCGISSTAHLQRVAAIARAIPLDKESPAKYTSTAALHDVLEDLFTLNEKPGQKVYHLNEYEEFLDRHIPVDLREGIITLTNHYDLILHYVLKELRRKEVYPGKKNVLSELEELHGTMTGILGDYFEDLFRVIRGIEVVDEEEDIFSTVKWECYKNYYISRMGDATHTAEDYRLFEIKAIDISDNGHGRDALSVDSRIRNIIKHQVYVNKCAELNSSWHPLNQRRYELQEDALVHAEHLVLASFLNEESVQDFVIAGLQGLVRMNSVFFTDFTP